MIGAGAARPVDGRSVVGDAIVILAAFLVAGVLVGVVWSQLVDPVIVTRTETGMESGEVTLANRFDHDAWYAVLGGGSGLLLGVVLTAWRRSNELASLVVVTAGAFLAAWLASQVGFLMGPEPAETVLAGAAVGATAPDAVTVTAEAAYLAWPLGAVLGAILVLWSPPGERLLERGHGSTGVGRRDAME